MSASHVQLVQKQHTIPFDKIGCKRYKSPRLSRRFGFISILRARDLKVPVVAAGWVISLALG